MAPGYDPIAEVNVPTRRLLEPDLSTKTSLDTRTPVTAAPTRSPSSSRSQPESSTMPVSTRSGRVLPGADDSAVHKPPASPTAAAHRDTALMPPPPLPQVRVNTSTPSASDTISTQADQSPAASTQSDTPMDAAFHPQTTINNPKPADNCSWENSGHVELQMIHYVDLRPNRYASGVGIGVQEPRFHCSRSLIFDDDGDNPTYEFGGPVMRIMADLDMEDGMPRAVEDLMVCNRDFCEMCYITTESGELMEGDTLTYALPFVHTQDCRIGEDGVLVFDPNLQSDYESDADCGIEQRKVMYLQAGNRVKIESSVCIEGSCTRCSPHLMEIPAPDKSKTSAGQSGSPEEERESPEEQGDKTTAQSGGGKAKTASSNRPPGKSYRGGVRRANKDKGKASTKSTLPKLLGLRGPKVPIAKIKVKQDNTFKLPMIHFNDLSHRNDVHHSRYQALHTHKFVDDSAAYLQGGQLYTVYFYASANLPARFEDVIICWDRACEVCSATFVDSSAAPSGGLPFVHLTDDTHRKVGRSMDEIFFQLGDWERGIEWDTSDIPRAGEKSVLCNSGGKIVKVRVEVCDLDGCRRCHPDDIDKRSEEVKAEIERQRKERNELQAAIYLSKGLPVTGPDHRPQDVKDADEAKSKAASGPVGKAKTEDSSPEQKSGLGEPNALRMCHHHHLIFEDNVVRFEEGRHRLKTIDEYFVPESSDIYAYGGPVYSVNFPNGTTRDVMACTFPICYSCKKRRATATLEKSRWGAEPFVHRKEIEVDEKTNVATFTPVDEPKYELPENGVRFKRDVVAFQGEDGKMRETGCRVCEEGTCKVCDEWQDERDEEEDQQEMA